MKHKYGGVKRCMRAKPLLITGHRTAIHIYAHIRFYSINHILLKKKMKTNIDMNVG
jgi:hypothetical protein